VFLGARDILGSIIGQREAAEEWPATVKTTAEGMPAAPQLGAAMARLSIPRLNASWYIVEGVERKQLRKGPGHIPGTAMPGSSGNCVISAHRDTHFRALKDIQHGDEIVVETRSGKFRYRVTGMRVVEPSNTSVLEASTGSEMSLITCYPFYWVGPAPRRFVVRAELEQPEKGRSTTVSRGPS
jgi:sortase A